MKLATYFASFTALLLVVGCASKHEAGVKSDLHSQWTSVAADTATTTEAARAVLESRELKGVTASSTKVDGVATGKMADGTKVHVDVKKLDAGSQVSVTVGTLGNPKLGAEIASEIKSKAETR